MSNNIIQERLNTSCLAKQLTIENNLDKIELTIELIYNCLKNNHKILICGNGGSASDALHISGEFLGRFLKDRKPLPAIALVSDMASITAISNDYNFEDIFKRQVLALGEPDDILWILTTSGNSKNLIEASLAAKQKKLKVISFSGRGGGRIKDLSDVCIVVDDIANNSARVQEVQVFLYHVIIELVENKLFV